MEVSTYQHPQDPEIFVVECLGHYGGTHAYSYQEYYTPDGIVIVADEKSEGSTTSPSKPADPNAPTPPRNGDDDAENGVAGVIAQGGYDVTQQPTIPPNDPFRTKYPTSNPDYKIEGRYFDLDSPMPTTKPANIADTVDGKAGNQTGRVIVESPPGTTDQKIQDVIDEIRGRRDTPDTATGTKLEELWVVKPDRTIEKLFPYGRAS